MAGATPKLITSASESSCLPNSDILFKSRAAMPSMKSRAAEIRTKYPARVRSPRVVEMTTEMHPDMSARLVKKLGNPFAIIFMWLK
jgi:hypothetical protein